MRAVAYALIASSLLASSACGRVSFRQRADASRSDASILDDAEESVALDVRDAAAADVLDAIDAAATFDQTHLPDILEASLDGPFVVESSVVDTAPDAPPDVEDLVDVVEASAPSTDAASPDAASPDADAGSPDFAIIDPVPPRAVTDDPRVTILGVCATDITNLTGSGLVDSDCSDGTWSAALTIDPQSMTQGSASIGVIFTAARLRDAGNENFQVSLSIELIPVPIVIDEPASTPGAVVADTPVVIGGTCATNLMNLTTSVGTFADADCSDGRWSLDPLPGSDGAILNATVTGERLSVRGAMIAGQDAIRVVFDQTGPGPLLTPTIDTPNLSDENFPMVRYMAPAEFNPSGSVTRDRGMCVLATDPTCTHIVVAARCDAGQFAGGGFRNEFRPWVPDNSTTTFYGQVADLAGNASACVPIGTFTEATPVERPTLCDVTISSDMTASEFAAFWSSLRAQASSYRASEGHVLVCLEPTVVVTLPTRTDLDIPGLYLRGLRGPGDLLPTCTLDSPAGTCARLISSSRNQFIINGGDITLENFALENGQVSLALGGATSGREFRNFVVRSPGNFAVIHNSDATGRWIDCSLSGTIGFAILGGSVGSMERTYITAASGFVLDRATFARFSDNIIQSNAAFSFQGDTGFFSQVERNLVRITAPNAVIMGGRTFALTETSSFFRSDLFDYSVCRMLGATLYAVRGDESYSFTGMPIAFQANTTGFGGPIGLRTFPDPRSTFDCP